MALKPKTHIVARLDGLTPSRPTIVMYYCKGHCHVVICTYNEWFHFLPTTPPDPSLNLDNLLNVTRDIPLWGSQDSSLYLDIPESLHDEITGKFDGEQAKRELFAAWLAGHPCPTWDHVERLLRVLEGQMRGRKGAAEEVKETYTKSKLLLLRSHALRTHKKNHVHNTLAIRCRALGNNYLSSGIYMYMYIVV